MVFFFVGFYNLVHLISRDIAQMIQKAVFKVEIQKLYGGERSDLASYPKSDRDLHVYVGLLPSADKR